MKYIRLRLVSGLLAYTLYHGWLLTAGKTIVVCSKVNFFGRQLLLRNSPLLYLATKQLAIKESEIELIILPSATRRYIRSLIRNPHSLFRYLVSFFFRKEKQKFNSISLSLKYLLKNIQVTEWQKQLIKSRPVQIIGIGTPGPMLVAANSLGINTIEVQHGIITTHNLDSYWGFSTDDYDGKPKIVLGWDIFFKSLLESRGIEFQILQGVWKHTSHVKSVISDSNKMLILLQNKTIFFCNFISIDSGIIQFVKTLQIANANLQFHIKLHPVTYNAINKILSKLVLAFYGIRAEIIPNLNLNNILPEYDQIMTTKSASVWEAWKLGIKILHFGELPGGWYPIELTGSSLFSDMRDSL